MTTRTKPCPSYEAAAELAAKKQKQGHETTVQNIGTSKNPEWVACWWPAAPAA